MPVRGRGALPQLHETIEGSLYSLLNTQALIYHVGFSPCTRNHVYTIPVQASSPKSASGEICEPQPVLYVSPLNSLYNPLPKFLLAVAIFSVAIICFEQAKCFNLPTHYQSWWSCVPSWLLSPSHLSSHRHSQRDAHEQLNHWSSPRISPTVDVIVHQTLCLLCGDVWFRQIHYVTILRIEIFFDESLTGSQG